MDNNIETIKGERPAWNAFNKACDSIFSASIELFVSVLREDLALLSNEKSELQNKMQADANLQLAAMVDLCAMYKRLQSEQEQRGCRRAVLNINENPSPSSFKARFFKRNK